MRRLIASLVIAIAACGPAQAIETTVTADLPLQDGNLRLVGQASPGALVTFFKNGAVIGTQTADSNSTFDKTFAGQAPGLATYSVYATDHAGRQTDTISFDVNVPTVFTVTVSDLLLPTTFRLSQGPIKRPAMQQTYGSSANTSTVTTFYAGAKYSDSFARQATAASNGDWAATAGQTLHLGNYTVNAMVQMPDGRQSQPTASQTFQVLLSADLNNDNAINLADFSALMFSYNVPPFGTVRASDINDDNFVNLADFSVMMFYYGR